ncbi:Dapdiamide A synthase (ATP-dependent N-fumaramoyl-DAP-amino acid ligase) [Durusdinium trenchii]|uniref:Dapdiamide A synthase (ATP-dependent N-fumaramoyl-DAP-amino acid ligase) n=1 Tax=Durusdinium trenchii TaxID=1381693 RepID=A0ABP0QY68_9DINO
MCKCPTDCPCQFACHACQCIRPSVVLVDPYSTGLMLAPVIHQRGYEVIALWTSQVGENREHLPEAAEGFPENFLAEIDEEATLTLTAAALRAVAAPAPVAAVICGGETGVQVADALAEQMGLRGNSIKGGLENRGDKQVQQDAVKAHGLRSVRSVCGKAWEEVQAFTETEPFPIIVKPVESAGSDGVKLCQTPMEAEAHFHLLLTSQRKAGAQGAAVLLQEYLQGTEYIVDHVSRNGVHKTAMVYVYDRRAANGAGFVCFGFRCVAAESPVAQELIRYTRGCLDALRITDGATHTEVMMTATGPCLVELNSRVNGAAGAWIPLARALTGYTQVDATVDAFLNGEAFDRLPDVPGPFLASGYLSTLVSYHEGHVEATHFQRVRELESVVFLEENLRPGCALTKSVDVFSLIGLCVLVHSDAAVLAKDLQAIREMELQGALFQLAVP